MSSIDRMRRSVSSQLLRLINLAGGMHSSGRASIAYIGFLIGAALFTIMAAMRSSRHIQVDECLVCIAIVAIATLVEENLPALRGASHITILLAAMQTTLWEAVLVGVFWHGAQYVRRRRDGVDQRIVEFAGVTLGLGIANSFIHTSWLMTGPAVRATIGALCFFTIRNLSTSLALWFSGNKQVGSLQQIDLGSCAIRAAFVGILSEMVAGTGWWGILAAMPAIALLSYLYSKASAKPGDTRSHTVELAALHLRTIEALALAIEAKDHTTHDHLRRVQVYAMEIGKELHLTPTELDALRAASLLHDIGKLAVPEHIISKPGKLTREEFEKMKIHPIVGAEILQRVEFPYPVAPIVAAHHEQWDGSGYPNGLRGEQIPIGARILSAVDCLDALASDRQYRRALPLDDAMDVLVSEAGKAFDPRVISVLKLRYAELEELTRGGRSTKLSTDCLVERGLAPAAGFEVGSETIGPVNLKQMEFLTAIASARQESHILFEMVQDLGNSLSLDETLSVMSVRMKKIIPFDGLAVYLKADCTLEPTFVTGDDSRLFSALHIPLGEGLSGWVAENKKPIINGNPSVEPGYLNDPNRFSTLQSALAVPLEGIDGVVGVLTLYHAAKDAFKHDHLRILQAISSKLSLSIENNRKYHSVKESATTDYLTGLPNARSLFMHLEGEVSRCLRAQTPLTVLSCDLDGFKLVNDRFGHLEGNRILRLVAEAFRLVCRDYDYVARMGGDEFVVILPGVTADRVKTMTARLCTAMCEIGYSICGDDVIGLSVGRAMLPDDGREAEALLGTADKRMYRAKRNRKIARETDQTTKSLSNGALMVQSLDDEEEICELGSRPSIMLQTAYDSQFSRKS